MNPALLNLIIIALEKGVPEAINLYHEIVDEIATSKMATADEKVSLLLRLAHATPPERNFIKKPEGAP